MAIRARTSRRHSSNVMAIAEPERPTLPIQPRLGVDLEDLPIFAQFPQSDIAHDKAEMAACTAFNFSFDEQLQDLDTHMCSWLYGLGIVASMRQEEAHICDMIEGTISTCI